MGASKAAGFPDKQDFEVYNDAMRTSFRLSGISGAFRALIPFWAAWTLTPRGPAQSRARFGTPELRYDGTTSSALLQRELKANHYTVPAGLAGTPTAFIAAAAEDLT